MVLKGDAGIGKSALMRAVGRRADLQILSATGTAWESTMAYAALHQLLAGLLERPAEGDRPHDAALRAAFGFAGAGIPDRFAVAAEALELLSSSVGEGQGFLLLADDVHWFDPESIDILAFLARHLDDRPIALLLATRSAEEPTVFEDLDHLDIDPLDPAASQELLFRSEEGSLPDPVADKILAWSAGNPLAIIELPRSLSAGQRAGAEPIPDLPDRPERLRAAFLARLDDLDDDARRLLLLAAADTTGEVRTLEAAAGAGQLGRLDALEATGLLTVEEGRTKFRHPVARAAVYYDSLSEDRRRAHLQLAAVAQGERRAEHRVWHRAAAATGPDEAVAADLEAVAADARRRGGHAAAAAALERSADLSPDPEPRARRLVSAAEAYWTAGRSDLVPGLIRSARGLDADPTTRARACLVEGRFTFARGAPADAFALLAEAARLADREGGLALQSLSSAAEVAWWSGRPDWAMEVAEIATSSAPGRGDEADFLVALLEGGGHALAGEFEAAGRALRRAMATADGLDDPRLQMLAGEGALLLGDDVAARHHHLRAVASLRAVGALSELPFALQLLASVHAWYGELGAARASAAEGLDLARATGEERSGAFQLSMRAHITALRGDVEECERVVAEALQAGHGEPDASMPSSALWALGRLELGCGRPEAALAHLTTLGDPRSEHSHPMVALFATPDLVEAAARCGRFDESCIAALQRFELWARTGATWAGAVAPRLRGLIAEEAEADREFETSLAALVGTDRRFEEGRTRLVYGEHLRRTRRRVQAREELRSALRLFELVGARPWAERAEEELDASGETARRRVPWTMDQLTPRESQIAQLVTDGASNQEVAGRLFISRKTVEYHLHKIYAKLEIGSRAELAAALEDRG
jgi:DNA-binding CsgD family transcriptional regulator